MAKRTVKAKLEALDYVALFHYKTEAIARAMVRYYRDEKAYPSAFFRHTENAYWLFVNMSNVSDHSYDCEGCILCSSTITRLPKQKD